MTHEVGVRNSEFGIPTLPPPDLEGMAGWAAHSELGMRNSPPPPLVSEAGGWAAFRIPNSEFRIGWVGGRE